MMYVHRHTRARSLATLCDARAAPGAAAGCAPRTPRPRACPPAVPRRARAPAPAEAPPSAHLRSVSSIETIDERDLIDDCGAVVMSRPYCAVRHQSYATLERLREERSFEK